MTTTDVELRPATADEMRLLRDRVIALYRVCFAEPPWSESPERADEYAELLRRCLDGEQRAWLCTHPQAPAGRLYEAQGWRSLGSFTAPSGLPLCVYTWSAGAA